MRLSITVSLIMLLWGCHSAPKPASVDIDRLADAYVSVLRLKAQLGGSDTSMTSTQFELRSADSLKARGFDRAKFQRQFESLSSSQDNIRKFNQRVQDLLNVR
jgi:hypothetical protein